MHRLLDRIPWPLVKARSGHDRVLARVPQGARLFITVDRFARTLRVYEDRRPVRSYPVGVGTVGRRTPRGAFSIQNKLVDPVWFVPDKPGFGENAGKALPPDSEHNRIRARWIGVHGPVGIHGTSDVPPTIPSHGCVKMSEADVVDLYERVSLGTPVFIV
jgi:lipoprotein-anchoring transpeptidase ErfK/SrfK